MNFGLFVCTVLLGSAFILHILPIIPISHSIDGDWLTDWIDFDWLSGMKDAARAKMIRILFPLTEKTSHGWYWKRAKTITNKQTNNQRQTSIHNTNNNHSNQANYHISRGALPKAEWNKGNEKTTINKLKWEDKNREKKRSRIGRWFGWGTCACNGTIFYSNKSLCSFRTCSSSSGV